MIQVKRPPDELHSTALENQSDHYPPEWKGRVPAQGRTLKRVVGLALPGQPIAAVGAGVDVELWINRNGAASAWVTDSDDQTVMLGLKPDEFEITGWYAELLPCSADCRSGIKELSDHAWHCPECNAHLTSLYLCDNCNKRWYPWWTQTFCGKGYDPKRWPCRICWREQACAEWYRIAFSHM